MFSFPERLKIVKESIKKFKNVKAEGFSGLVVEFAKKRKASCIIRGLRLLSDFEYEFQMALTNRKISPSVETIFLMAHQDYSFLSSTLIKEAAFLGPDFKVFFPPPPLKALKGNFKD